MWIGEREAGQLAEHILQVRICPCARFGARGIRKLRLALALVGGIGPALAIEHFGATAVLLVLAVHWLNSAPVPRRELVCGEPGSLCSPASRANRLAG